MREIMSIWEEEIQVLKLKEEEEMNWLSRELKIREKL